MGEFDVGQPVPRTEDPRLLTGGGRYVDDVSLPRQTHAWVVRSPYPHARITRIDRSAAERVPGVLAVLTGADYADTGYGMLRCYMVLKGRDGRPMYQTHYPPLAVDRVRFIGDYIALVVAETRDRARDAAELVEVEYEPLPANTVTGKTMDGDTPLVWDDCPRNECFHHVLGDKGAVGAGFAEADHVVRRRFVINRVMANTMEPRACIGEYDPHFGRYTLYTALHYPHRLRQQLAEDILHVPQTQVRVVAGDIGGSFGLRGGTYPEYVLMLWASKDVGRPVKWLCDRSEGFISDNHGRDNVSEAELALDSDGNFLAMRVRTLVNLGAYLTHMGTGPAVNNLGTLAGVYTTPAIHVGVSGVFSNTNPTCPYRGAGRPEAAYIIEQLIETAARELNIDPVALRRRNTIPPDAMPFKTGLVFTYDSGEFEKNMDDALDMADHGGFAERREDSRSRGALRGIGLSNTIERAGAPSQERAAIRFDASGGVTVFVGTISQGQGHDTVYKQIIAQELGVPIDAVRMREGDTDTLPIGGGTGGSRSATLGGSAVYRAAQKIAEKGRQIAAHLLEAADSDVELKDGCFLVAGTDRSVTIQDVAKAAYTPSMLPPEIEPGLDEGAGYAATIANYPNGCHVCEVEIDPDTGVVDIVRYSVVDDVGTVLNPLLLKGQIQGGVAQGVGQAIMEDVVFEPESGQLLSGSFMDYCMPRADDLCAIDVVSNPVPTKTNPLGVKGAGEAGTVGALPAVTNAIVNALESFGVTEISMPATPERIWKAINTAEN